MNWTKSRVLFLAAMLGFMSSPQSALAQLRDSIRYTRFQFAQTYLGIDFYNFPASGSVPYYGQGGIAQTTPRYRVAPRINMGGPHFWGHAEFFVNIPVFNLTFGHSPADVSVNTGTETGFRLYPWSIYQHKLSPFAGFSWSAVDYRQVSGAGTGPSIQLSTTYFQAGLTWQHHQSMLQLGIQYQANAEFSYPLSRNHFENVSLSPWQGWLSFKYLFDTTHSSGSIPYDTSHNLQQKNHFSVGLGLASAFGLRTSSYIRPFLEDPVPSHLSPDISLGYHFSAIDASARLSYRRIIQDQNAYGVEQRLSRNSVSLEAIKFLGDYHGFVPFMGVFGGPEFLTASETDQGDQLLDKNKQKWSWGISAGWDIRPTGSSPIVLRTNLRYAPFLSLQTSNGKTIRFDQLEVDFIQVVVYPQLF